MLVRPDVKLELPIGFNTFIFKNPAAFGLFVQMFTSLRGNVEIMLRKQTDRILVLKRLEMNVERGKINL